MKSRRLSLAGAYTPKGWEYSARLRCEWRPDLKLSGKLSAAINRPSLYLGVSAELVKPLSPWQEGYNAAHESPEDYFKVEIFYRYRMKF